MAPPAAYGYIYVMELNKHDTPPVRPSALRPDLKIGFVLLDKFTLAAFATFIDAIRLAADRGGRSRKIHCSWSILGNSTVGASCGLEVVPNEPMDRPERFDYIAVCGGNGFEEPQSARKCAGFLQEAAAKGVRLIGVCSGSFALAEAGLLDGYRVCVHWNVLQSFTETYPAIKASSDQLFIDAGERITCAGSMGGADLALSLIRRHCSPEKAQQAARHMMLQSARPGDFPQPHFLCDLEHTADTVVRRAALLMEQSLNEFRPIAWFAARAGVSVRQLERRFKATLGLSPAAFFRRLRLDYAAFLLRQTDLPVLEIAIDAGFVDGTHMTREFKRRFLETPSEYRATGYVRKPAAEAPPSGP